jgi:hypothetical protein
MQLDLRIPIGLMFGIFGLILAGVGLFGSPELTAKSLGINMNLWWGVALLVFSAVMLLLASKKKSALPSEPKKSIPTPRK